MKRGRHAELPGRQRYGHYLSSRWVHSWTTVQTVWAFRSDYAVGLVAAAFQVTLVVALWSVLAPVEQQPQGAVDHSSLVTYVALAFAFEIIFRIDDRGNLESKIRTGAIYYDLSRPISGLQLTYLRQLGTIVASLPKLLVALGLAATYGALNSVGTISQVLLGSLSSVLGAILVVISSTTVSMLTFWTLDAGGVEVLYRTFFAFASGALVPPVLMPQILKDFMLILPPACQVYYPVALLVGDIPVGDGLRVIGLQIFWATILGWLNMRIWDAAVRRVPIVGG